MYVYLCLLYRSSTIITYSDPKIDTESLYISASVLDVDFSAKKYTISFLVRPNGTLANAYGELNKRITLRFSSIMKYELETGDAINPIHVTFAYDDGDEIDYPLDFYTGYFSLHAHHANDTAQSIPMTFHLDASITSFHFMPTLQRQQLLDESLSSDAQLMPNESISLKIRTGRSTATVGFSIFICVLMWILSLIIGIYGYQVVFRRRSSHIHTCMFGITTLFALPAVRSAQPGIPDIGCVSDILGFYWNMAILACSCIGMISCWVFRWEDRYDSGTKYQSEEMIET